MNLIQLFIQMSDVTGFIRPLQLQPEASLIFTTQISAMFDMGRVRRDLGKKSPPRVGVKRAKCTNVICDIYWHSISVHRVYMQPQIFTLQSAAPLHGGHRAVCSVTNERETPERERERDQRERDQHIPGKWKVGRSGEAIIST